MDKRPLEDHCYRCLESLDSSQRFFRVEDLDEPKDPAMCQTCYDELAQALLRDRFGLIVTLETQETGHA